MKRHRKFSILLGDESGSAQGHSLGVDCISHSSDGSRVVTGSRDATVRVWENGVSVASFADHADAVHDVLAVPHSSTILSCSSDNTILVYSNGKQPPYEFAAHFDSVRKMALLSSSSFLSASLDGSICTHDLKAKGGPMTVSLFRTANDPLFALSLAPMDGKFTAIAGSASGHLYMVDPRAAPAGESGTLTPVVSNAHKLTVRDIVMCDGGTKIISAGADGLVKVWDARHLRAPVTVLLHSDAVFSLAAVPNSPVVLSGGRDGMVVATNLATLESAPVVAMRYPVTSISISPRQVLFVGTTNSTVDGFVLSAVLPPSFWTTGSHASQQLSSNSPLDHSPVEVITPSKVSLEIDVSTPGGGGSARRGSSSHTATTIHDRLSRLAPGGSLSIVTNSDLPPLKRATPLILADPVARRFEASYVRSVVFASTEEQQTWCTSSPLTRPRSLPRQTLPEPDMSLLGSCTAIVSCCLLNDKRHVLTVNAAGHIALWCICSQKAVFNFPLGTSMHAALARSQMETYFPSWCTVECRWGTLCVTLSAEVSLDAFVNRWATEFTFPPVLTSPAGSVAHSSLRSIYKLSRSARTELQQAPLVNLSEMTTRTLLKEQRLSVVVWSVVVPGGQPQGLGKRLRLYNAQNDNDVALMVPSWVFALFHQPSKILTTPSVSNGVHNLELIPFQKSLPALKQSLYSIPKRRTIGEVAGELVQVLKVKLPKTKELASQIEWLRKTAASKEADDSDGSSPGTSSSNAALAGVGNQQLRRWPISDDPTAGASDEASLTALWNTPMIPDEFIEFIPPGENGQPHPTIVVEPMMMVTTAFFTYKARGSGVLTLWYRKNALLPS